MPRADVAELRALVAAYHDPDDHRRVLAVAAEPRWNGPETFDAPGTAVRVVGCPSPLAVRAALVDHRDRNGEVLVVLTECSGSELGLDVRAQLIKGDVLPLDPFPAVLALFRARVLDPQLVPDRWLIDDLVALAPAGGWPARQPVSGVLDADLAWRTWHEVRLHVPAVPATVADVLALAARTDVAHAVGEMPPERRRRLSERWSGGTSGPIPVLVDLLAADRGPDLVPLGLVAHVLWTTTDEAELASLQAIARARLESTLGRDRLDGRSAAVWSNAARAALEAHVQMPALLERAEQILSQAGATDLAVLSDVLPTGFDQRLRRLGAALTVRDLPAAEHTLVTLRAHRHAGRRANRLAMAEAAVRLMRRSQRPRNPTAVTFGDAVVNYVDDGAWVESARRLLIEGDQVPELTAGYGALAREAAAERDERSRRFAALLAEWSASEPLPDSRFVPVEAILDHIVTPIAAEAPVLLVVCDGMSLAVSHTLLDDLVLDGWNPAAPDDRPEWPVGVATLPTVTETSRASLLCGRRSVGGPDVEREAFGSHAGLRAVSAPTRPPRLIHKGGLIAPSGIALPEEVREAVADPDQRVVGVVVNAVDDHLARGDQVRVGWDMSSLRPMSWLLDAAAEAGRVVVITADHGHVLHGPGSTSRVHEGGGERWRVPPPAAAEDEVEVAGPRVLLGGGRLVLPADEWLRYGGYKHGYHGGATPDEVLVPIEVVARRLPEGWSHRPVRTPDWWGEPEPVPIAIPPPLPARLRREAPVSAVPTLFDEVVGLPTAADASANGRQDVQLRPAPPDGPQRPAEAAGPFAGGGPADPNGAAPTTWVNALLSAPAFVAHRRRARLARPVDDRRLRSYLDAIVGNGFSIPLVALAARTGEPGDTLRLTLSLVQRLLNLDGSPVLVVTSDGIVQLNRQLANLQFEIDEAVT